MKTFKNLAAFKAEYTGFFFERKTMKMFNSRIETDLIKGRYFITSEDNFEGTRVFNVREIGEIQSGVNTGKLTINTLGGFDKFTNLNSAKTFLRYDVIEKYVTA